MIGNNTMIVNQATMIKIVQMYLDCALVGDSRVFVKSVESDNSVRHTFRIEMTDTEESDD